MSDINRGHWLPKATTPPPPPPPAPPLPPSLRLADEEREAVEAAIIGGCEMAETLRKLLERLS